MNVNAIIEIVSLVSRAPKRFRLALASRRVPLSGNTSLMATFYSIGFYSTYIVELIRVTRDQSCQQFTQSIVIIIIITIVIINANLVTHQLLVP